MTATEEATDASPLLPTAPEIHEQSFTSGWTSDAIRTATLAAAFLVFFTFADVLKYISSVRLVELGICREHYLQSDPSVIDDHGNIPENLCKSGDVQQRLAHLRGYLAALESIVGLLLTLPYGLIVDRVGERAIASINVFGYLLSCGWLVLVCFYYSIFPIWMAVLAPLFRILGGGAPVMSFTLYAIVAKHVPAANRSVLSPSSI
jgi:MFS family permease